MKIKLSIAISKVMVLGYSIFSSSASVASDQWAMNQANASHTGYVPVTINPSDITFRWKKTVGSSALSPVTVAQNQIYVSIPGYFGVQHIYAIKKDGTLAWGKSFSNIYSVNPPSYANGKVYVQTGNHDSDTYLRAYSASSGNLIFQSPHAAQWERYLAPTIYKDNVYVNGGSYGGMYSFNAIKDHQNWFYELPQVDGWTPAVDEKLAYSYIGALYAVDRLTGKAAFKIINSGEQAEVPMLGGLNDVFVIDGGLLSKFRTDTKKIGWQKTYNFNEDYAGQPALANKVVYAGTTQGSLVALDQVTGNTLWTWKNTVKGSVVNNLVVTKSHVFLATANKIYAIDIKTHQNVWSYAVSGQLALGESGLYVASGDGKLTAFKLGLADIFAPSEALFKSTAVNAINTKKITIKNVGDKTLTVNSITSSNSSFVVSSATSFVIPPNQNKVLDVNFEPKNIGNIESNLVVKSDDGNEPEISIKLKGRAIK